MTGNELHDSAERGPVDREGARGKLPKHNTSFIRGLRWIPGRSVLSQTNFAEMMPATAAAVEVRGEPVMMAACQNEFQ